MKLQQVVQKARKRRQAQGMTEYIIIVALIAIAAIGVVTLFGNNLRRIFGTANDALAGEQNKETGADYYTLTIRDHGFNANLGKAANQDDLSLQAVIPWGPKDAA